MKLERRSESQSSRGARLLVCAGGVLSCVLGCTAYPTLKPNVAIDCTADSAYDLQVVNNFELGGDMMPFYTSGDMTSAPPTEDVEMLPDGPRCNSNAASVFRSVQHNDWGSLFGYNNFGPRDASAYEGVSFWARAPRGTTSSFTILLDDPNTNNGMSTTCSVGPATPTDDAGAAQSCRNYCTVDAGMGAPVTTYLDPMTGMAVGGSTSAAPPADACGNGYMAVQVVTEDWRFYTIPFSKFQQGYMPNRVPNSLLTVTGMVPGTSLRTSALMGFVLRFPKEANAELWFDNLSFYRPKKAGSDGGADAPRM
jgi:hypothetical protein